MLWLWFNIVRPVQIMLILLLFNIWYWMFFKSTDIRSCSIKNISCVMFSQKAEEESHVEYVSVSMWRWFNLFLSTRSPQVATILEKKRKDILDFSSSFTVRISRKYKYENIESDIQMNMNFSSLICKTNPLKFNKSTIFSLSFLAVFCLCGA